ncbi:MAG: tRNA (uridine(34)/cytosine(34)/5-carboxymethylaminomethyluridine(34)-2'-O)-methyltransferase TrmL, partial [Candidatus Scatosoma sp.]
HPQECVRIPMIGESRSLNLSNAVAIAVYEGLRQNAFAGLQEGGNLHRLSW